MNEGNIYLCIQCHKIISKPRISKGKMIQKFCNDRCRYEYHKKRRKDNECMLREIMAAKVLGNSFLLCGSARRAGYD